MADTGELTSSSGSFFVTDTKVTLLTTQSYQQMSDSHMICMPSV